MPVTATVGTSEGSVEDGAASQPPFKHPNAAMLTPLWLGDGCEGLSGLVAAVNGVRLAVAHRHRVTLAESHMLMRSGLRFLDGRLTPQQCVMNGLRVQLWRRLVEVVVEAARQRLGLRITVERIHVPNRASRVSALDSLDEAVRRLRVPIIMLSGGIYTVVSGTTASSLMVFDGRGACWLSKRTCGVARDGLRHTLHPTSFLTLDI